MAEEIKFSEFTAADPATLEAAGGIVPSAVAGIGNNKSTWTQIKNWISNPLLALINNRVDKTKPMLQIMIGGLRSVYFSARWFAMDIEDSQPTSVKGAMWYGSDDNLPVVNLDYGVTGSLLDDVITPALNKTGSVIPNGTVCYVSGSQGNRTVVSLAQAVLTPTTQIAIVVATHNVANNALGYFVNRGLVNQLNTSAYTEGQILWVSTTAGQLTGTAPAKPYSQIAVGIVTRVHATVGQIRVFPSPIPRLGQLTDVDPTGIVTGQALRLNSSGVFEPYTPLELGETASTAYRGDRGKVAYDHSQLITDNPHNVTVPQISGLQGQLDGKLNVGDSYTKAETTASNVINTPSGNISSTNVQSALNELDNEKAPALVRVQNKQSGGTGRYKVADYSVACNANAGGYFVIRVASHDTWETNGFCDVMFKFRVLDSTFTFAHQVVGGSPDIGGGMQWRYTTDGIRYYFAMSYYAINSRIWSTILDNQMSSSGSVVNTVYNITDAGGTSIPYLAKTPDDSSNTTEIATTAWSKTNLAPINTTLSDASGPNLPPTTSGSLVSKIQTLRDNVKYIFNSLASIYTKTEMNNLLNAKAPTNHATTSTTYGSASTTNYGHVRLATSMADTYGVPNAALMENAIYLQGDRLWTNTLNAYWIRPGNTFATAGENVMFIGNDYNGDAVFDWRWLRENIVHHVYIRNNIPGHKLLVYADGNYNVYLTAYVYSSIFVYSQPGSGNKAQSAMRCIRSGNSLYILNY